ncbi:MULTISPECIES: hypothetical protein [unclassified Novosphingobium]|uniref:hypothetical protein n=1 Tax=unclassified Novosphingobium TaxID=2644732 RepID=UPI0025FD251A|nr:MULTISPECIES: hypothetical protein [unclassified Novosphingobium]
MVRAAGFDTPGGKTLGLSGRQPGDSAIVGALAEQNAQQPALRPEGGAGVEGPDQTSQINLAWQVRDVAIDMPTISAVPI